MTSLPFTDHRMSFPKQFRAAPASLAAMLIVSLAACQADTTVGPGVAAPARVSVSLVGPASLTSFGDSAVVRVRVFDDADRELTGIPLVWSTSNGAALESLGGGVFRSRANGASVVRVSVDPSQTGARPAGYYATKLTDSVAVSVVQTPARVVPINPDTAFTLLNATRTIGVTVTDARGNVMTQGFTRLWSTGTISVAVVDNTGRIRAVANGSSQLTVRVGPVSWSTTLQVNANRAHVSCMRYVKRKQAQQQCVTNSFTMLAAPERAP